MRKTYFLQFIILLFGLHFNSVLAQGQNDFGAVPNGSGTTVVIQDVLANDGYLPVTLSDVYFTMISSSTNYLSLDTDTGSVLFTNGPAPIGTYYLDYYYGIIGNPDVEGVGSARVSVNIGCEALNAPVIASITPQSCTEYASVQLTGMPATDTWYLLDRGVYILTGTGTSVTINNVTPSEHIYSVINYQGCYSPPVTVDVGPLIDLPLATYNDANLDGVPSIGDTIDLQLTVTNIGTCALTNVTPGSPFIGGPLASLSPGAVHTFTGTRALTASQIAYGVAGTWTYVEATTSLGPVGFSKLTYTLFENQRDGIQLIAFIDSNNNGIKDVNEQEFHNGNFVYVVNNDGISHYLASGTSPVIYEDNPSNAYDLNFSVYSDYNSYYTLTGSPFNNVTVAVGSGVTAYYFPLTALTISPYVDTAINLFGTNPRPGFTYTNTIVYSNNGSDIIPSGTVSFTKDNAVSIISVSESGAVLTPTGFTYDFTNLLPGEWNHITVTMQVPTIPTVALGQTLTNSVAITIPPDDVNVNNNAATLNQTIIGSYDPNDKAESHGSRILFSGFTADDYLTYTIRFENTGTANAEFVRVVDVLDDKLDETSVRMVDASDSYTLNRVGNTLEWFFDNIQLPPSIPETTTGHGYIVFQVKPKPGYALGDVISNTADIYFDFNPPIVTNTATTEFVNTLVTRQFAFDNLQYYPNPVKNTLSVSNDSTINSITITSVLGQQVLHKDVNDLRSELNLSELADGVYFVKVISVQAEKTFKIIKE